MTVSEKFIKNIKVLADRKAFSDDDIKLILLTVQEMATLSVVESMSLLDNLEVAIDEARTEMPSDEFESIKKELLEDQ